MATDSSATINSATTGDHAKHWTANVTKAGTYELNTAGTFVDRDIDIVVPAQTTGTSQTGTSAGTITPTNSAQYINISTGFQDSAKYWKIEPASSGSAATLSASATGSATISSVSVGAKDSTNSRYPVTGSASITGTATATTTASGFATKDSTTGTGSTSGTASLSANIPAASATVTYGATASSPTIALDTGNDNISVGAITTTKPTSGYYAAVKATAPATTLSATTKTINTAGYLGDASEISSSAATTAKTGSNYYVPITSGTIGVSDSASPTGYTENTTAVVPSAGSLLIDEGYYPKTFIKLETLVPDKSTITADAAGQASMRTGTSAYDNKGNLITGTMGNATITSGSVTVTAVTPSYNSTSGKFDVSATASAAAPTVGSSGYISSSEGTRNSNASTSSTATLNKVALTASKASGDLTKAPTLARTAKPSADTWTDGANGAATTTKPTSGVYVQIDAAANTNTLSIKPQVGTAGYGDTTNYGSTNWTGTVGAAQATTAYVPIKSGSKGTISATASATGGNITLTAASSQPSSGYYVKSSASASMTAGTAGWISSTESSTSGDKYYTLPTTTITGGLTAASSSSTYTAPTLATSAPSGAYVTLVGKGTGAGTGVVSTSVSGSATRYIPIYEGSYTLS